MATEAKTKKQIKDAAGRPPMPVSKATPTAVSQSNLPAGYTPAPSIDANNLGTEPLKLPQPQTPTAAVGLTTTAASLREQLRAKNEAAKKEAETGATADKKQVLSLMERISGQRSEKADAYEEEGVNDLRVKSDSILSEMEAADLAASARIDEIEKNAKGLESGALADEVARIRRENAKYQAERGISLAALNREYETAKSIIDQKVDAETEDLKFRLDYAKYFYEENKDALSDAEQKEYQQMVSEEERAYDEARDIRTQIGELQLEAASNGAPASVISAIGSAEDITGAIGAMGGYARAPKTGGSTGVSLGTEKKASLLAANFTADEIATIESDVNEFGLQAVLGNISDPAQRAAVEKAYTGEIATKLTRENLSIFYGLPDDGSGKFLGMFGKTTSQKLDDVMSTVERYRALGIEDKEILKTLQSNKK